MTFNKGPYPDPTAIATPHFQLVCPVRRAVPVPRYRQPQLKEQINIHIQGWLKYR